MKPKPFDALNHFTLPVGTSVSPMSAFWMSPLPSFRREAIGRSLLRSFRGKNTGRAPNGLAQFDGKSARPAAFPRDVIYPDYQGNQRVLSGGLHSSQPSPARREASFRAAATGVDPAKRHPRIYPPERWFSSTNMGYHGERWNDIFSASFPLERDADA